MIFEADSIFAFDTKMRLIRMMAIKIKRNKFYLDDLFNASDRSCE